MTYVFEALLMSFSEKDGDDSNNDSMETGFDASVEALGLNLHLPGSLDLVAHELTEQVRGTILRELTLGRTIPQPQLSPNPPEGAERMVLVVDVSLPKEDLLPFSEVMHILQVTQPRISHLIRDGRLIAVKEGRNTLITRASLEEYLATPSNLGRPRKVGGKKKGRP